MLGFIDALKAENKIKLYDGCSPRDLIKDHIFEEFFGSQLNTYDAVLLIVPPGQKKLDFPNFTGETSVVVIPGQIVHETCRMTIPVIIGFISNMLKKYKRICILTQSAVLSPLLAIYIPYI